MNARISSAWLVLLLSFLIAIPPAGFADDTEMFTTAVNPNVLLMLDSTGSMSTNATGTSTSAGDLDGDNHENTRMDILWKVVYTLLNADLSVPEGTTGGNSTTWTCQTSARIRTRNNPYTSIEVDGANWSHFPSSGTVFIGDSGVVESITYTSKSINNGHYYLNFPSYNFQNGFGTGTTVSYTVTSSGNAYIYPYPTNNTEAMSAAYLNNLTTADEMKLRMRIGLMTFTTDSSPGLKIWQQVSNTAPNSPPFTPSYQTLWSTVRSNLHANGMTPAAQALQLANTYFDAADRIMMCGVNKDYAVIVTDGEDTAGGLDNATGSNVTQRDRDNSVIYRASLLKNRVFNNSPAPVKLFTIGVGVGMPGVDTTPSLRIQREVLRRAAEQNNAQFSATEYATIGGIADSPTSRGMQNSAFFADDAKSLATAFGSWGSQVNSDLFSFTSPTVASIRMTDRNYVYMASFKPSSPPATFWEGHLRACTTDNLSLCNDNVTPIWDAGNKLKLVTDLSTRRIYTSDNTWGRHSFDTNTGTYITSAILGVDNDAVRNSVVDYVRGANHDNNYRLGDIFHSKPVVVGPPSQFFYDDGYSTAIGGSGALSFVQDKSTRKRVVYVGTNDGMLHAFLSGTYNSSTGLYDSGTGEELFGYIPNTLLGSLENFLPGDLTKHEYFVDSSPRVADVWIDSNIADGVKQSSEWKTVLISGLRKGGNAYFALDITDPPDGTDYSNYPKVLWEYKGAAVGETWSEPFIGKIRIQNTGWTGPRDRWVAIFGGGKSATGTVGASLIVLDIATGTPLTTFTTGIDNMIVASPTAVLDAAGYIKFVYVADLDGSVYRFDFRTTGTSGYSEWKMRKIFEATTGQSTYQPVYHRVEVGSITENSRYLFFGTGDQDFPISNTGTGKFYAIKDADTDNTLRTQANLTPLTSSIFNLTGGTVPNTSSGWYIDFTGITNQSYDTNSHSGEKVLSDPVVFYNAVYFTTFTPKQDDPCSGGVARVYGLNMYNAGAALAPILSAEGTANVPYHVFSGGAGTEGGVPSSPSLSIYPSGQSSIFIGFSTGVVKEIKIESPPLMKSIKSWKEIF